MFNLIVWNLFVGTTELSENVDLNKLRRLATAER